MKLTKKEAQQIKDNIESVALIQQIAGCQRSFAKDSDNRRITSYHKEACEWCTVGALHQLDNYVITKSYITEVLDKSIPTWNDSTPQKQRALKLWEIAHNLSLEYNLE